MNRILVSMTSYPGRISNVGRSIFYLLKKQTLPPDEIHLWLSKCEFPNGLNSLPADLQVISKHNKVKLHWLERNTYVHKRHEIFKQTTDELVFLIDDDVRYNDKLIETVVSYHKRFPNCMICYNRYPYHKYNGRRIIYGKGVIEHAPQVNLVRWCGQSMIPSNLYPKLILDDAYQEIRDKTSPVSDECWFQPWTVLYDIPILHLGFDWGVDIDNTISKWNGLCKSSHFVEPNGYERRDNWLFAVVSSYPALLEKYKRLYNYG